MIIAAHKQGFTFGRAQTPFPFLCPTVVKPNKLFPSEIFLFLARLYVSPSSILYVSLPVIMSFRGFFVFFSPSLSLCKLHTDRHTEVTVSKQCLVEERVLNRSLSEIGCFNCCQRQNGSGSKLEQLKGLIQSAVGLQLLCKKKSDSKL